MIENRETIKNREDRVKILEGSATIEDEEKSGTNMNFTLKNVQKGTKVELPYIYYVGYNAKVNINGTYKEVELHESDNGFVEIDFENDIESATISVFYEETIAMKISAIISIISLTIFIIYVCKQKKNR